MTHCPKNQISALLDGQLGKKEEVQVEHHLRHCESCRSLFQELASTSRMFRDLEILKPPDYLWTRIATDLHHSSKSVRHAWLDWQEKWLFHPREYLALAAALLLMIGGTIFAVLQRQASTRSELAAMARIDGAHTALIKNPDVFNPFRRSDRTNPDLNPFARHQLKADSNPFGSMKEMR